MLRKLGQVPGAEATSVARNRLLLGAAFGCAVFALIGLQVVTLSLERIEAGYRPVGRAETPLRGWIFDRNGRVLASSLAAFEIYADPAEVMDPVAAAIELARLLPDMTEEKALERLTRGGRYSELAWKVSPQTYARVLEAGIVGVHGRKRVTRFYPQKEQAAHVLGNVDKDNKGLAGVEAGYDAPLSRGEDIHLSIDLEAQAVLRQAIAGQIERFEAVGGAGIVLDIRTGEIVALVSLPDYDPNGYQETDDDALFNRATRGVYELGSTFKILNTAMALDSGVYSAGDMVDVVSPLRVGRFTISDFHAERRPLNVAEVMVVSSNKGSARIAAGLGVKAQRRYVRALGLLDRLDLGIPEVAEPLVPSNWKRTELMTISYGHGLSVSPLHLAAAVATAVGDGIKVEPSLLAGGKRSDILEEVFSPATTRQVRAIMRRVVTHPRGTGKKADVPGYIVGGKTGTAEKNAVGGYSRKANIASFVGAFPLNDPRFVVMVMVDEPKGQQFSHNYATGGWVAAPAVRRFIAHAAPLLDVAPVNENSPEIRQILAVELPTLDAEAGHASY